MQEVKKENGVSDEEESEETTIRVEKDLRLTTSRCSESGVRREKICL